MSLLGNVRARAHRRMWRRWPRVRTGRATVPARTATTSAGRRRRATGSRASSPIWSAFAAQVKAFPRCTGSSACIVAAGKERQDVCGQAGQDGLTRCGALLPGGDAVLQLVRHNPIYESRLWLWYGEYPQHLTHVRAQGEDQAEAAGRDWEGARQRRLSRCCRVPMQHCFMVSSATAIVEVRPLSS